MELILYIKNNQSKLLTLNFIKFFLIILIIVFSINKSFADENTNKYHTLQVTVVIKNKNYELNKDLTNNTLAELVKKDLLIFHATSELKLTKHRIENLYDKAQEEIISNLQSLGYYHAKITTTSLEELGGNKWMASYKIDIGRPTIIKQISLQIIGEAKYLWQKEIKQLSTKILHVNNRLIHDDYEKTKQSILSYLHDCGFLNAKFATSSIEIHLKDASANIIFIVDSKQQYYLGKVIFESDVYQDNFLNKYVPFKERDLYSNDKLMLLKNNLLNSGLFNKVRIETEDLSKLTDNIVPIKIRAYGKPANKYTGSLGFGTDTGIRGNLGYLRRRQAHLGHELRINLLGSKIRKQITANYHFLGKNPMIDKYNFGLIATQGHINKQFSRNAEFYTEKSKKHLTRQQFWRLSFLTEKFRELPASEKKITNYFIPSIRLEWTHPKKNILCNTDNCIEQDEDNKNSLTFGNKISFITKITHKALASSANLLQLTVNEKFIHPLIYDLRLIFKGTIATTVISDFNKLPISLRFFAGGDHSVRGFAYNSLGPYAKDPSGNKGVIGGKHLFFSSLEIEKPIPIYPQLSMAWFIDAGNALNTFDNFNFNKLAVGTGLGIGYQTPIGTVRAYLAKPIKHLNFEDANKKPVRFHLTFGADL